MVETTRPAPVWGQVLALEAAGPGKPAATHQGRGVRSGGRLNLRQPLSTDARTRARLRLVDGTELILNRGTTLVALGAGRLDLRRGEIMASVRPRMARDPLTIRVPTGMVRVLGTKFNLSAGQDLALVDVVHGAVRIFNAQKQAALVGPGEEGALPGRGAPSVSRAPDLGRTLSWTAPAAVSRSGLDRAPAGLGSLTAFRPGRPGKSRPLRLARHQVTARVQQNLARTQITETFQNPTGHTLEGVYRFPLPPGARISRLALYVGGRLEEGTVVERGRAQKIWRGVIRQATPGRLRKKKEEYIWVPGPWKDPALLQWRQGNQFELRIFPIPARGKRTVVLAYTETLAPTARGRRYVYPLPDGGEVRVGDFSLDLDLRGHDPLAPVWTPGNAMKVQARGDAHRVTFSAKDFTPSGDLVVDFATRAAAAPLRITTFRRPGSGEPGYVLLSLRPRLPGYSSRRRRDVLVLVDRSHSALGEASRRQRMLLRVLVTEMDGKDRVKVLACRATCSDVSSWEQASSAVAARLAGALDRVRAGGATDLGEALRLAGKTLTSRPDGRSRLARVIYLGDGIPSVGELQTGRLAALVRRHLGPHRARLTTVGVGTSMDTAVLTAMARAGSGCHVPYAPGLTAHGQALTVLSRQYGVVLDGVEVTLPTSLTGVAPQKVSPLFQGEELLLAARASGPVSGEVKLSGRVNGEPFLQTFRVDAAIRSAGGNAFVPRLWAWLTIQDLDARLDPSGELRGAMVRLSKDHHLLTRHTSLLVLESEAMRRAFGVSRGRRAAAWSGLEARRDAVQKSGLLGVLGNSSVDDDAHSGLGILGHGGGGGGSSKGGTKALGNTAPRLPGEVIPRLRGRGGQPGHAGVLGRGAVHGSLSKQNIRQTVRRQLNEVRGVYQRHLKRDPRLSGRYVITFTIGPTGQVLSASLRGAPPSAFSRDLVRVVRRWRFPAPSGGGTMVVSYPLVFRTAGVAAAAPQQPGTAPLPPLPRRQRMVRMRRVWFQQASLRPLRGAAARDLRLVALRRRELASAPLSQDRHRRLYAALARAGQAKEALRVLQAWLARDPRSREALELLAEATARLGQHQRALQALGSLLDQDPSDAALHRRMVAIYQAAGNTRRACAHRLSLGSLAPLDTRARGEARDCREGYVPRPASSAVRGRVTLRARWQGAGDLDLALVTSRGRRISWLSNRRRLSFARVTSPTEEQLGVRWLPPGRYRVELSGRGSAAQPVSGVLHLRAPGLRRRIPFTLRRGQTYLAELRITRQSRLVEAP